MFIGLYMFLMIPGAFFGLLYAATRKKGSSASERVAKGCGFTAAFPLIFVVLILLVVIFSKLFSAGSGG